MRDVQDIYSMKASTPELVEDYNGSGSNALLFRLYDNIIHIDVVEWVHEDGTLSCADTHLQYDLDDYARQLEYVGDKSSFHVALRKKIVDAYENAIRRLYELYLEPSAYYMNKNSGIVQTGKEWITDAIDEPRGWNIFAPEKDCDDLISVVWHARTQAWVEG